MATKYKLNFTPVAYEDLDQIYNHIAIELQATKAATELMENIEDKIMRLKQFPYSCELVNDTLLQEKGYRKLIIDNYIVFYIIEEKNKNVIVMRIIYGARQYERML